MHRSREDAREALAAFLALARGMRPAEWQGLLRGSGGSWRPRSLGPVREVLEIIAGHADPS